MKTQPQHTPTTADPAELEIAIGYANPDCLDSDVDYDDENVCEARRCYQEGLDEYYEEAAAEAKRAIAKAEGK